jgi:prophage tail gpP-like protein
MPDKIELFIAGEKLTGSFSSYSINSDLYLASDEFSLELANPDLEIKAGTIARIEINGQVELCGIIDKVEKSIAKSGRTLKIDGRDMMGLVCDHHCQKFGDISSLKSSKLKNLAEYLLADIPFISRKSIIYQEGAEKLSKPYKKIKVEPGNTVFEVLSNYAIGRGLLFYCLPDGTFVFGKPRKTGQAQYSIICSKASPGRNNYLEARVTEDISGVFSQATIVAQIDGYDYLGNEIPVNVKKTVQMAEGEFPYFKPFVKDGGNDDQSPSMEAQLTLEKFKAMRRKYEYTVPYHSQNGRNWRINELVRVDDSDMKTQKTLLIYSRTFNMEKRQGPTTRLVLGAPGVIIQG